jgi:hypothetical protein
MAVKTPSARKMDGDDRGASSGHKKGIAMKGK